MDKLINLVKQFLGRMKEDKKLLYTVIGVVAVVLIAVVALIVVFCSGNTTPSGDTTYTVEVKTEGGLRMSGVETYVYTDATLNDLFAVAKTDAEGKMTFTASSADGYVVVLKGVPTGYDLKESYAVSGETTQIILKPQLLTNVDMNSASFHLGSVMFDFTVTAANGTEYTLSKLLESKKAVVLKFWLANCQPCQAEFPFLQEALDANSNEVAVIAVNPVDGASAVSQFQTDLGLTIPMAAVDGAWERAFGIAAYPTTVVIDRFGTISLIHKGPVDNTQTFTDVFAFYTADTYVQQIVNSIDDLKTAEAEQGTESNPYEFGGVMEFEIPVAAGKTVYCDVYKVSDMRMSIADESASVVYEGETYTPKNGTVSMIVQSPDTYTPVKLAITNTGSVDKTYKVTFRFLPGALNNPYELTVGEVTADVPAGSERGVYYSYIAEKDGTVTVKCIEATKDVKYTFTLYNLTSCVYKTLDTDAEYNTVSIEVKAGDELQFSAGTLPNEENEYPAATLKFTVSFEETQGGNTGTETETTPTKPNTGTGTVTMPTEPNTGTGSSTDEDIISYTVTVVDEKTGVKLSGISVKLSGENGEAIAITDASGMATFQLPAGTYKVTVTPPSGYKGSGAASVRKKSPNTTVELSAIISASYGEFNGELVQLVDIGENTVDLKSNEVTYFIFCPTHSAKYSITCTGGTLSYWNNTFFSRKQEDAVSGNTLILNVKQTSLGGEYLLGVTSGGGTSGTLVITSLGAAETDYTDMDYQIWNGTGYTPTKYSFSGNADALTYVDITKSASEYILSKQGNYYYIGDRQVFVNLSTSAPYDLSMQAILTSEYPVIRATIFNGSEVRKEEYTALVRSYVDCVDERTGLYPLTDDLMYILRTYGHVQNWWDPSLNGFLYSAEPNLNAEIAWMYACCY